LFGAFNKLRTGLQPRLLVNFALVSFLQGILIFFHAKIAFDLPTLLITLSWFSLLLSANILLFSLLKRLLKKVSESVIQVSTAILVFVPILMDTYHFYLFKSHLNRSSWDLAVEGVLSGEAGADWKTPVYVLVLVTLLSLIFYIVNRLCYKGVDASSYHSSARSSLIFSFLIFSAFSISSIGTAQSESSKKVFNRIPLSALVPAEQAALFELKSPILREPFMEEDQIAKLEQKRQKIVKGVLGAQKKPNILMIHVESLRADMFNAENMPHMTKLVQGVFKSLPEHYSTGSNIGTGLNGILNGLNNTYYQAIRHHWFQPITLDILKHIDYQLSLYLSRDLRFQKLDDLYFSDVMDHTVLVSEEDQALADEKMLENYLGDLSKDDSKARFDYMIFYATHYNYFFSKEF